MKLSINNTCYSWINVRLILAHVDSRGVSVEEETSTAAMTERSQVPSGCPIPAYVWIHSRHLYPAERVCGEEARIQCENDICHHMCDLLAVCHPI